MSGNKYGFQAERLAAEYLVANGYKIEATGWKRRRFEMDIIASRSNALAFIEVKASKRTVLGAPELRVNKTKQKKIIEAASEYLSHLDRIPDEVRFDVIGVVWDGQSEPRINHIESAFSVEND